MKITSYKTVASSLLLILSVSFSPLLFSETPIQIDTILTDTYSQDKPGDPKDSFSKNTPMIYIIWKSDQLKQGQKIKSVWIADDTHNVAPANYKIDEAEMTLDEGMKGKILSHLPGAFWDGKFTINKPNSGWPIGQYHTDIYVDGQLVKTVKFNVADSAQSKPDTANKKSGGWGAISADSTSHDKDCAYGVGGGASKEEAEKFAQNFCKDAGGEQCAVMLSYQECGAYALSKDHQGAGTGSTKETSETIAKNNCKDADCIVIASDCN